ncbi:DUF3857 domain-containing protein [Comamonadaceae bacterium G21597-S1]|nr:DUF3857 domain-containing protein [Comamonadaceae bacterium G21597-S1]
MCTVAPARHRPVHARTGALLSGACIQLLWFLLSIVLPVSQAHGAGRTTPLISPPPGWVEASGIDTAVAMTPDQVRDGIHYLLYDRQVRITTGQREQYQRTARKALNGTGVETIANVSIAFDPSYQTLIIHAITLHRGTQRFERLTRAGLRVLQREKELDSLIYDGTRTANVFLDDVRVGDVVDVSFTLRGHNPVFGGRHFGLFDTQWRIPVHRMQARLIWPVDRPMYFTYRNAAPQGQPVAAMAGFQEIRWRADQVAPIAVENDLPEWYDPYPHVQWSNFRDWSEVAQWALPLYRTPGTTAASIEAEITRIAQQHAAPADRAVAALRFVQANIRYLGIEVGAGSHAPTNPATVLARRFGDCKDKTLLLLTMLQGLGIEARAALVDTRMRRGIADWQPSPGAFNHVIVRARVDGTDYWIDPTLAQQHGSLALIRQADYGMALVVDADTRQLQIMPLAAANWHKKRIHALYDSSDGLDKPVRFTLTTVSEGAAAENQRALLARGNADELQRNYLNYYAKDYPGLALAERFSVDDDRQANRLTMVERYTIHPFWTRDDSKGRQVAAIETRDVWSYLGLPRDTIRTQPMRLGHPEDFEQVTEVRLPEDWSVGPESVRVDDPAFQFSHELQAEPRLLTITNRFRSNADHLQPGDVARYVGNLRLARDSLGLELYKSDAVPTPPAAPSALDLLRALPAGPVLGSLLLLVALIAWSAHATLRFRRQPLPLATPYPSASPDVAYRNTQAAASLATDPVAAVASDPATPNAVTTPFHAITVRKYLLMYYCTLGLYDYYWGYRNWWLIRQREQTRIIPVLRALFGPFFSFALFGRVRDFPVEQGAHMALPVRTLALGWLLVAQFSWLPGPYNLLYLISPLFTLPVVAAIRSINQTVAPLAPWNDRLDKRSWVAIAFGLMVWGLIVYGLTLP